MTKAPRSESNPARILILDDEHDERCLLSGLTPYLTRSGYIVLQCLSAESAVEQLQQEDGEIDLLISDVALADSSGVEVCLGLQAFAPALKLLFTSGCPVTEWSAWDANLFRELPSNSVRILQKPFSALDLLLRVDELIGAAPEAARTSQAGSLA
jgi:response regulator RpfG family c-di-GMP phosphodiesterase